MYYETKPLNINRLLTLTRQVIERKHTEDALRESEERYRSVFESGAAAMIAEEDMTISMVNREFEKIIGYSKEEVEGKMRWTDFFIPEDWEILRKYHFNRREKTEEAPFEHELHIVDRLDFTITVLTQVTRLPGTRRSLFSLVDLTDRKRAEEALSESEKRYRLLVNNASDAIFVTQDRVIKFPNPKTHEMLGYSREELAKISFDNLIHPEHREMVLERDKKRLPDEKSPSTYSFKIMNKQGEEIWTQLNTVPISWDGRPATLNFLRDITPQKKIEAQLQQAQKMEAIGTLAGGVAHDFNNLLTAIVGNADLALMDMDKENPLYRQLKEIIKAGEKAATLTRQLLAFSRKQMIQPKVLNLNKVISDIEKMLGRLIREDIELATVPGPGLWRVKIDPGQMEQVIMNLAVNARDAMPQGGRITIETANVDLGEDYFRDHFVEEQAGLYVVLTVSDTGTGMDEEIQPRIFEPFFTTKERGKGTGLGLSTVYGIVKQNGGYVWVKSTPGRGATFKVYLPRAEEDEESSEKALPPVEELSGSETLLIVEDDHSLRDLARKALERHGYRVIDAQNGEDALRVREEHEGPIHLLVTDVVMPGMGGRELAERLQPLHPEMKVLYVSGHTDDAIAHHGVVDADLNFLQKPFTPAGLARKVREVLDG